MQVAMGVLLVGAGLALGATGWTGLRGTLRRNRFAGVRTPASMSNERAFAVANRVAAPALLAAAGVGVVGGVAAMTAPSGLAFAVVVGVTAAGVLTLALAGGTLGSRAASAAASAAVATALAADAPSPCAGCTCGGPGTPACAALRP